MNTSPVAQSSSCDLARPFTSAGSSAPRGSVGYGFMLRPNVGLPGIQPSKKWTGKLLEIPPSENQLATTGFSGFASSTE